MESEAKSTVLSSRLKLNEWGVTVMIKIKQKPALVLIAITLTTATVSVSRSLLSASATPETPSVTMAQSQNVSQDEQQIIKAAKKHLTKGHPSGAPPVEIDAVTIVGPYATVDWFWGEMGGQALLLNQKGIWQVAFVDGGAFTSTYLVDQGVPSATAKQLVRLHEQQSLQN